MLLFPDVSLPSATWTGWHRSRRGERWQLKAEAADEEECRRQLRAAASGGDFLILAPGRLDPNDKYLSDF